MRLEWFGGCTREHALATVREVLDELLPDARFGPAALPVGIYNDAGRLQAVWIWTHYAPASGTMEFTGAARSTAWLTRGVLTELFDYAFDRCACQMIVARVRADNEALNRQLEALAFNRIDVPRMWGREDDGILWTLTDDAWLSSRFRRSHHG